MEYCHQPVLLAEALHYLNLQSGSIAVDATIGGGGHAKSIAKAIGQEGILLGLDVDEEALNAAAKELAPFGQQIRLFKESYRNLDKVMMEASLGAVDAFLFDLGVASFHLDNPERGFSYQLDGPLDMRFDRSTKLTAAEVVNTYSQTELVRLLKKYGEEKWASRIAQFIVERRKRRPITRTLELVEVVKEAIPAGARRRGPHPARHTFQALRIEVNKELEGLKEVIEAAVDWLKPGGRLVIISYHSLEDRLVKREFQKMTRGCICPPELPKCVCGQRPIIKVLTKKPVIPSQEEVKENPRARSAKLRAAEKLDYESSRVSRRDSGNQKAG
jgi:16S rRNA (cytosine1402-N4)-methyltransferase